jgi:excisionase family DNA binding protein
LFRARPIEPSDFANIPIVQRLALIGMNWNFVFGNNCEIITAHFSLEAPMIYDNKFVCEIVESKSKPVNAQAASARHSSTGPLGIPFMQRPTCTIKEACKASGMGRTKFYELIKGGELKTISVGRRRLVQVPSLLKLLRMDNQLR